MAVSFLPPPKEVLALVEDELSSFGGRITDCSRNKGRLFLRATVPHTREVHPNDHIQGGVAVTTYSREICVFPYVYRQMQKSAVIVASAPGIERIQRVESGASAETLNDLRQKIRDQVRLSASSETLSAINEQFQSAAATPVDSALHMSAVISRIPRRQSSLLLSQILSGFHEDEDTSVYAFMNAIAMAARDEEDPATKWDLEALAGNVPTIAPAEDVIVKKSGGRRSRAVASVG